MNEQTMVNINNTIEKINDIAKVKSPVIVSIDGMSGSGKTSFAKLLSEQIPSTIVHMDDFFLRAEQRTEERLNSPGGNLDVERLTEEVVVPVSKGETFIYKPFDCHTMSFKEPLEITPQKVIILEGSYSCHPLLFPYCDLHIFLHTKKLTQIKRILLRSGYDKTLDFINKWIPMENKYFEYYQIPDKCELKFST